MLLELDGSSPGPLHRRIADALRAAILDGRLAPGARVPSTRSLARDLAVARMTALAAYEALAAEGYLEATVGSGTRVSRTLPEAFFTSRLPASRGAGFARAKRGSRRAPRPSARGRRLVASVGGSSSSGGDSVVSAEGEPRPFALGVPALDLFPRPLWCRLATRVLRTAPRSLLATAPAEGHAPLRRAIAAHLRATRGVRCSAAQVIVTAGSQAALDLVVRVLADPGDVVWAEDPGYHATLGGLSAAGLDVRPVPVDAEGLDVARAAKLAPRPRLVFATPSHQFPLGVTMTLRRRLELLAAAARSGAIVVEDDYDAEFRYGSPPTSALQGLDRDGRVVYVGTFSKSVFPALRLGYLVAPPSLAAAFAAAQRVAVVHAPTFDQAVLAEFVTEGHFERHLRRMRTAYAERRDALLASVRRELGGALEPLPSEAGLHVTFLLPPGASDRALAREAAGAGFDVTPLSTFHSRRCRRGGLVLGFAATPPREIRAAVARLRARIASTLDSAALE